MGEDKVLGMGEPKISESVSDLMDLQMSNQVAGIAWIAVLKDGVAVASWATDGLPKQTSVLTMLGAARTLEGELLASMERRRG